MNIQVTAATFSIIISSVFLSSIAQIILKIGMTSQPVIFALKKGDHMAIASSIILNVYVFGGLLIYLAGAILWLFVLAKIDVSIAYPFVGLGFILTMILARYTIGDPITATKLIGTILVSTGILLITQETA